MFFKFFQSVFKSSAVSTSLAKINNEFIVNPNIYSFNAGNSLYFDEASLQKTTSFDDERRLFIWVSQIARYFKVGTDIKGINSKENTGVAISKFLKEISALQESTKKFLCTDEHALNCLILALLLNNNKNDWDNTLELIRQYNTLSSEILAQLEWFYDFVFNSASPSSCEQLLNSVQNAQPVSHVLQFMILATYYLKNPSGTFKELKHIRLPFTEQSTKLEILAELIKQGILATQYTKHPFLYDSLNELKQIFRVEFQKQDTSMRKSLKKPEDREFLEYFIIDSLNNIKQLEQEEQLIGLSQMICFFSMKTLEFYKKIHDNSCLLVQKLFSLGKYTEAYLLHDDVIQFVAHPDKEMIDARIALYCMCCRLEQWLSGSTPTLKFNSMEEPYIEKLKKSKLNFKMGSLANEQLFDLAKKMVQQFARSDNKTAQDEYKGHYNSFIKKYLSSTQQKTINKLFESSLNKVKKIPEVLPSSAQQEKNKQTLLTGIIQEPSTVQQELISILPPASNAVPTVLEKPSMLSEVMALSDQEKVPDVVQDAPVVSSPKPISTKSSKAVTTPLKTTQPKTATSTKRNKQEKVDVSAKTSTPAKQTPSKIKSGTVQAKPKKETALPKKNHKPVIQTPATDTSTPNISQLGVISSDESTITPIEAVEPIKQPTAHSTSTLQNSAVFLNRSQIPNELLELIDELRKEFPKGKFYLTGAAPGNMLDGKEPNDYDLLVLNIPLYEIQHYLSKKKITSEQRSFKYPILYCALTPKIFIDFSAKFLASTQTEQELLEADFYARDFNLNALYMEFTDQSQFSIFSFSNALANRADKKISDVLGTPVESLKQDPVRLFRLAKLMINYPDYKLTPNMNIALKELQPQWLDILNVYLQGKGNIFRLDHVLRKLFLKCSIEEINDAFAKLHVLPVFTGNSKTLCNIACARIPQNLPPEYRYFGWRLANFLQHLQEKNQFYCPLPIALTLTEANCMQFVAQLIQNNADMGMITTINEPTLIELLIEFHLIKRSPQPSFNQ